MRISDYYKDLSYGILSNIAIGSNGKGVITEQGKPQVLLALNEGLLKIFQRFNLREKTVEVIQIGHITNYHLLPRYAASHGSPERYPYIQDSHANPFEDEVLKILRVNDKEGRRFPLNDPTLPYSLFTPEPLILQVPHPKDGDPLFVSYQARHPVLVPDDESQEIGLPHILVPALNAYVGFRIFNNMGTQDSMQKAQGYLAEYESLCGEADEQDNLNTSEAYNGEKFKQRGFV